MAKPISIFTKNGSPVLVYTYGSEGSKAFTRLEKDEFKLRCRVWGFDIGCNSHDKMFCFDYTEYTRQAKLGLLPPVRKD